MFVTVDGILGKVWGIDRGKVLVEFDYMYLVAFDPEKVVGADE
jgi:hypothetical protein